MDVDELTTAPERREAVPLLGQLWPDEDPETVFEWTGEDDYHLFGGRVDGELVGVAGALVAGLLHHRRHAWLYDLVVDGPRRGEGHGSALVAAVERWAEANGCEYVALASPRSKADVHRFYEDQGYEKWGYVVEKEL